MSDMEKGILDEMQGVADEPVMEEQLAEGGGFSLNLSWLKAPTGEGTIEERLNHPLNPSGSAGVAQIIRGFEGLLGDLGLAIIDIVFGGIKMMEERRGQAVSGL